MGLVKSMAKEMMKEIGALDYIETSALTGDNIEDTFDKIGNTLLNDILEN